MMVYSCGEDVRDAGQRAPAERDIQLHIGEEAGTQGSSVAGDSGDGACGAAQHGTANMRRSGT
jgi:hypothetical protein